MPENRPAPDPAEPTAPTHRSRRIPRIVAAAVALLAVVAGLVVARHGAHRTAGTTSASCAAAAMTFIPVDVSGGVQIYPLGDARSPTSIGPAAVTTTAASPDLADIAMGFGGKPTTAPLCLHGAAAGSSSYGGVDSDGTPLGYSTVLRIAGSVYLLAAVGPDVEQVQVQASVAALGGRTASSADPDPGFTPYSDNWFVDGGVGPTWSTGDTTTTRWTDLGGGWHGFALLLPWDAATADVLAFGSQGILTQIRSFDPSTGRSSDDATPPATTTAPPGSRTAERSPIGLSPATAGSESPDPASVQSACAGLDDVLGISDAGFALGTVQFAVDGSGGLCFQNGQNGAWAYAPARPGAITGADVVGPGVFVAQDTGKRSNGRLVWGAVKGAVAAVLAVATDGTTQDQIGGLIDLPAAQAGMPHGGKVFLIRVPATGAITITAVDTSGTTLDTVTLP